MARIDEPASAAGSLGLARRRLNAGRLLVLAGIIGFLLPQKAIAGGPRFVTGTTYWAAQSGVPIAFRIPNPLYYTDPGALSAAVSHAQADGMVAAAAAAWNVPTASLTLSQGGALAEHVSSGNMIVSGGTVMFPADVDSGNYLSKPLAIIYDTDGSVTDLLLGVNGSDPSGCRQNGVTESVDRFGPAGTIDHALIIINGRCATAADAPLLQLQYQVERAFGRVLGLAWSQLNDNVFTSASPVTAEQIANWPIMHPLDVICGTYTYQCITSPFTLRADDRNALESLYPVTRDNQSTLPGKVLSTSNSAGVKASLQFPTGQGMDMVNVTVRRMAIGTREIEPFQAVSGVSGVQYQQVFANAIRGAVSDADNVGTAWQPAQALVSMPYIEVGGGATLFMTTEPINPLYVDEYAIAPYSRPPVTPSGSAQNFQNDSAKPGTGQAYTITFNDAPSTCAPGADGTEWSPASSDGSGWWNGLLCSVEHTSWWSVAVKGGRSWTMEVDALDERGALTLNKAQPVLGLWRDTDPTGTTPTVASTPVAMNTMQAGVTQIKMPVTASDAGFRVAIADQFGGGRPDFFYRARILAVDAVTPSVVAMAGGEIILTGRGFQPGMQVQVNGVSGAVMSSTSTQIVARIPSGTAARATGGSTLPVVLLDPATGGSSTVVDALRYSTVPINTMVQVSAPSGLKTGVAAATSFAVRVLGANGITPVAGATVRFAINSGTASLIACGSAASCTVTTNSIGIAQTTVTGGAAGPVELSATELSGGMAVTVDLTDADPVRSVAIAPGNGTVVAGSAGTWALSLTAALDGSGASGVPVTWTASNGLSVTTASTVTDSTGTATASIHTDGQVAAGTMPTVTACAWTNVCATWAVTVLVPVRSASIREPAATAVSDTAGDWNLTLTAIQDGVPTAGVPVVWSAGAGIVLRPASPVTGSAGQAAIVVHTDGLAAGSTVTVSGCVWVTVCASWQVTAVAPVRSVSLSQTSAFVFAQTAATWNLSLQAVQNGAAFAGAPVSWSGSNGLTLQASTTTNVYGQASASVITNGLSLGTISTVTACAWSNVCASWQVTVVDAGRVAIIANAPGYVASSAGGSWTVTLTAVQASVVTPGAPVTWTGTGGLLVGAQPGRTDASGQAAVTVTTTGLSAGSTATLTGCAWTTACTTWQVTAVDPAHWHISVTGGAAQTASAASALAPITLAVVDDAGHAIQGAPVTLYQTVAAWEGLCGGQGRCAAAPVLAFSKDTFSTDANGLISVTPLQLPGVPQVLNLAAVTGTAGFVAVSVPVAP